MNTIKWKDGCDSLYKSLRIPQKRADDLDYRLQLIIHEVNKPVRKGESTPSSDVFIKMCIALAENEQELVFCAYVAGISVNTIYGDNEIMDESYEEEDEP